MVKIIFAALVAAIFSFRPKLVLDEYAKKLLKKHNFLKNMTPLRRSVILLRCAIKEFKMTRIRKYFSITVATALVAAIFSFVKPVYAADALAFNELYGKVSVLGIEFSDKLKRLEGKRVEIKGFMAPPLKPTITFFVLTQRPMSICPFCSSDADWPIDIIVVKVDDAVTSLPYDRPITVTGILELGSAVDADTGFVSMVRIRAEKIKS